MQKHKGGCHCGKVRYEVEVELKNAIECNCSHCQMKGLILAFVPAENFKIVSGEDNLTDYRFNKKFIAHLFCKDCGVQSFSRAKNKEGKDTVGLNMRCIDDIDLKKLNITPFDGKNW